MKSFLLLACIVAVKSQPVSLPYGFPAGTIGSSIGALPYGAPINNFAPQIPQLTTLPYGRPLGFSVPAIRRTCPANSIPDADNTVCCPKGCSVCGGKMCGQRKLGGDNCCASVITKANKQCGSAPCVLNAGVRAPKPTPAPAVAVPAPVPVSRPTLPTTLPYTPTLPYAGTSFSTQVPYTSTVLPSPITAVNNNYLPAPLASSVFWNSPMQAFPTSPLYGAAAPPAPIPGYATSAPLNLNLGLNTGFTGFAAPAFPAATAFSATAFPVASTVAAPVAPAVSLPAAPVYNNVAPAVNFNSYPVAAANFAPAVNFNPYPVAAANFAPIASTAAAPITTTAPVTTPVTTDFGAVTYSPPVATPVNFPAVAAPQRSVGGFTGAIQSALNTRIMG